MKPKPPSRSGPRSSRQTSTPTISFKPGRPTSPPSDSPSAGAHEPETARPAVQGDLFYGLNTCMALWNTRADEIQRLYVTNERLKKIGQVLQWCAKRKRPYHVVTPDDMARITKSVHHEGLALVMKPTPLLTEDDLMKILGVPSPEKSPQNNPGNNLVLIYLDGVKNPHNLGSIMRTAAHFGCPFVLGRTDELPRLSPSAARIAEGGMTTVRLVPLKDPEKTLQKLSETLGLKIVGTASPVTIQKSTKGDASRPYRSLYQTPLQNRMVLVLGNEVSGMSPGLSAQVEDRVFIPGTGQVESLNVAIASGIILAEHWRLYGQKK